MNARLAAWPAYPLSIGDELVIISPMMASNLLDLDYIRFCPACFSYHVVSAQGVHAHVELCGIERYANPHICEIVYPPRRKLVAENRHWFKCRIVTIAKNGDVWADRTVQFTDRETLCEHILKAYDEHSHTSDRMNIHIRFNQPPEGENNEVDIPQAAE